jgi:ribosomal protein L7Ae-like RNA K-turn-binding protein
MAQDDRNVAYDFVDTEELLGRVVGTLHSVPDGESVTIPDGYSEVVVGPYDLDGELTVDGRMEIR